MLRASHGALIGISSSYIEEFSKFVTSSVDFWNALCCLLLNVKNGKFLSNGSRAFHYQTGNFRKMAKMFTGVSRKFPILASTVRHIVLSAKFDVYFFLYPHLWLKVENNPWSVIIISVRSAELAMLIFFKQCETISPGRSTKYFGICCAYLQ